MQYSYLRSEHFTRKSGSQTLTTTPAEQQQMLSSEIHGVCLMTHLCHHSTTVAIKTSNDCATVKFIQPDHVPECNPY